MAATTTAASDGALEPRISKHRNFEIEGLRAIAALMVLVTHVSLNAMGNKGPFGGFLARLDAGVAVFFVLSGYLLYRPFARSLLRAEPLPGARRYLRHRLIRIVPAYWVVVVASFLFAPAAGGELPSNAFSAAAGGVTEVPLWTMLRFVTFTQVYWKDSLAGPFPQAWTLATEMAFYFLLPVVAWAISRRNRGDRQARVRRQWWVLGSMFAVAQAYRLAMVVLLPEYGSGENAATSFSQMGAWLPNHLDLFAAGMAIAVLAVERDDAGPSRRLGDRLDIVFSRWGMPALSVGIGVLSLVLVGYAFGLSRTDLSYGRVGEFLRHASYLIVALALVVPAVFGRAGGGGFRWFLKTPVMQYLGKVSYGIYLWQIWVIGRWVSSPFAPDGIIAPARNPGLQFNAAFWPMLVWTVVITVALASATWYLVERPWLRYRDRRLGLFAGGVWTIALVSFATRIVMFDTATARNPGNGDPFYYHAQANMLADGIGFGEPIQWLTEGRFVPSAIHPPLFTLWLTPASLIGSRGFVSHKTMAAFAGVAVIVVAALLARRLAGDRAGIIAAAGVALYPNLVIIDGTLWPEGLYTALVGLALVLAYRWRDEPSLKRAAWVGAAVGGAILTRGEAIFLLPMLCLPLAISGRKLVPRWWAHGLLMGIVALGLLAPWTVRNLVRFSEPTLVSTNSQEVLYYANCEDTYDGPLIGYWSFNCQQREREARIAAGEPADPPGDESQRASGWGEIGRAYALDNTDRWPAVAVARVTRAWDIQHTETNARALQLEGRPYDWSKRGLWVYRVVAIAGLVGLVTLRRRGTTIWPLVSMLAMVTVTAVAVYGHVRFRTVGDLVLLVGAAVAVDAVISRFRNESV